MVGSSNLIIYHIQYSNDNLVSVDAWLDNLWLIKTIL